MNSEVLIERWRVGGELAADMIYHQHREKTFRLAYGLLGNAVIQWMDAMLLLDRLPSSQLFWERYFTLVSSLVEPNITSKISVFPICGNSLVSRSWTSYSF